MKKYFYKVKSKIKLLAVHGKEMICTEYCDDVSCFASEQDKNDGKSLEAKHKYKLDEKKIQLSEYKEYDFTCNNKNGLLFLKGLLHGAFKKNELKPDSHTDSKEKELYEETLLDYLKDRLKLIWGQYYFIDPSNSENDDAKGYFLSNKIANTNLEPSFSFPFFSNIKNIRGNYEFHKTPNEWLHFYIGLNETVRSEITFKKDFIKYFENLQFIKRRNKDFEQFNNLMYISSGEIDHSIIQWFIQTFEIKNTSTEVNISLDKLGDNKVKNYIDDYLKNQSYTSIDIFIKDKNDILITKENLLILEWFKKFGLINYNDLPTERLITAIEFFYFHLTNKENSIKIFNDGDGSVKNKVSYQTNNYFFNNSDVENSVLESNEEDIKHQFYDIISDDNVFKNFKESCDKILPTIHDYKKIFEDKSEPSKIEATKKEIFDLISSYIDLLILYGKKKENFKEYIRFNVVSHFFQRNIIGIYNPIFKEETCKGFIISPFFSNPRLKLLGSNSSNKHKFLGYFLCLIKDSDDKGRNFFNWRIDTHGHKSKTVKKFYTEYLTKLLDFGRNIGVYETQNFFYKGILDKHINELEIQSTKSAISEIINRNMAHHITSHVSNRATLDKVLERIGKSHSDLSDANLYHTILDLLKRFNQYRDERSEYLTYITSFSSPSSAYFFQDVIRPFIENTLLMDNISANENINYEKDGQGNLTNNKLQLKVKYIANEKQEKFYAEYYDVNNKKLYCSENLPYLRLKNDKLEYPYDKIKFSNEMKDIEVSLPGTLGKHALYSILENFIRNSAKHGLEQKKNGLDIVLLLNETEENIEVTLTDNCSVVNEEKIKEFNESIKTEILRRKDLGLIDMKVNACLLAGLELNDENCKKALEAILNDDKLAYKFKIAKPKKAVFIGDFVTEEKNNNGFYYFKTIEGYRKSDIHKSFQFAILSDNLYDQQKVEIACELPARILKFSEIEKDKAEDTEYLYEVWLKKLRGNEKANVHLFFEQNCNTLPTKEFKAKYEKHQNLNVYSNEDLQNGLTITNEMNIFFDRHGGLINKFSKEKSLVDTNHSWILIDKNNSDFDYISRYDIFSKSNLLAYELEEAGLLKVLVIDERVAEQSVRKEVDSNSQKISPPNFGFSKFDTKPNITLFDTAWAANVFIATHLNGDALKMEIDDKTQHKLNVKINEELTLETNITSLYGKFNNGGLGFHNAWIFDNNCENKSPKTTILSFKPDITIMHRTILKKLLEKKVLTAQNLHNIFPNLIITTGSGTTHGIDGNYKILPFSTLSELICGKRIQKLKLTRQLLTITKNNI